MTDLSLAGPWTLHDASGAPTAPCPIPGDVHSALIAAGRIPDPMIGTNEADVQWVAEAEWEIRRALRRPGRGACRQMGGARPRIRRHLRRRDRQRHDGRAASTRASSAIASTSPTCCGRAKTTIALRFRSAASGSAGARGTPALPDPVQRLQQPRRRPQHAPQGAVPRRLGLGAVPDGARRLCRAEAAPVRRRAHRARRSIRQDHHDDGSVTVTAACRARRAAAMAPVPVVFAFDDHGSRGRGDGDARRRRRHRSQR